MEVKGHMAVCTANFLKDASNMHAHLHVVCCYCNICNHSQGRAAEADGCMSVIDR